MRRYNDDVTYADSINMQREVETLKAYFNDKNIVNNITTFNDIYTLDDDDFEQLEYAESDYQSCMLDKYNNDIQEYERLTRRLCD